MNEETALRRDFKKVSDELNSNTQSYDDQVTQQTDDNSKTMADYHDTLADLQQIKQEYNDRIAEKKKRDAIAAIMKKKEDEQKDKLDKLERASEYIQAVWRGWNARKECAKATKGKKKKKKKK